MKTTKNYVFLILMSFLTMVSYGQLIVTNSNDSGPGSLRDAVGEANDSPGINEIIFDANYTIALTSGEILVTDNLTITGSGVGNTVIDASSNSDRIFNFQIDGGLLGGGSSILQEITLTGGTAAGTTDGGGAIIVDVDGGILPYTFSITNSEFSSNTSASESSGDGGGGAIYVNGAILEVNGSTFTDNMASAATGSGGAIFYRSDAGFTALSVTNSTFDTNTAGRAGGAIEIASADDLMFTDVGFTGNAAMGTPGNGGALHISGAANSTFTGGTIAGNSAGNEGGGLWNGSGTMTITGTTIDGNNADGNDSGASGGGGIYNEGGDIITLAGTMIINNVATTGASGSGGGLLIAGGSFVATETSITGNLANRAGGGIEVRNALSDDSPAALTLTDCLLDGNNAGADAPAPGNGGGLHITGPSNSTFVGGTVSGNSSSNEGGGLWNGSGKMTITGSVIDGNNADGIDANAGGGGIYNEGGELITDAANITNNLALMGSGSGGGLLIAGGSYAATGTTISGNQSNRAGGGIEVTSSTDEAATTATITLNASNLDDNETGTISAAPGNGGGLHVSGASNVTITGGTVSGNVAAKEGGGLWNNQGVLTVTGATINANEAQGDFIAGTPPEIVGGGGIFAEDGMGAVIIGAGTSITNNLATGVQGSGGGILMATGTTLTINGTTVDPVVISGNAASRAGGGLEDWSLDTNANVLTNVNFMNNTAGVDVTGKFSADGGPGNGGAIHVTGAGNNTITGGIASGNIAANEGGGFWNGSGVMTIVDTKIDGNTASGSDAMVAGASGGGGIYNEGGTVDISGIAEITNNIADGAQSTGGGILNAAGTFTATGVSITANESNRAGGGIETNGSGPVTLIDVNLDGNMTGVVTGTGAPGNGGALHVSGDSAITITGGTVSANVAVNEGGALWNGAGTMSLTQVMIDGNTASGADGGGGLYNNANGTINLQNSTVSNNVAANSGNGGGITNEETTILNVTASTISGNTAASSGGGIYNNGTATVLNATIAINTAADNGGGISAMAPVSVKGSIIAENIGTIGADVDGTFESDDYNLIGDDSGNIFPESANDLENIDALLAPLADNGGLTLTHTLLDGSPAINAGDPEDNSPDQLGNLVFGDTKDIGAFELNGILGVGDVEQSVADIVLYPNPSSNGQVSLKIPEDVSNSVDINVIDLTGKQVHQQQGTSGTINLDLSKLASGMYIINVIHGKTSKRIKFLKSR